MNEYSAGQPERLLGMLEQAQAQSAERMADDNRKRRALGRGLSALIPGAEKKSQDKSAPRNQGMLELALDDVVPNRNQPRKDFDDPRIQELAKSVSADGVKE